MNNSSIEPNKGRESDTLFTYLKNLSHFERTRFFNNLISSNLENAFEILLRVLYFVDDDINIGAEAAFQINKLGNKKIFEQLVQTLSTARNPQIRANAAYALGGLKDLRAVEPLINALSDYEEIVRVRSANSLAALGDKKAIEPLLKLFRECSELERNNIIDIFGELGDERAFEPILEIMKQLDDDTYFQTITILGCLNNEKAFPLLINWLNDQNVNVQIAAAKGLGYFGDSKALDYLRFIQKKYKGKSGINISLKNAVKEAIDLIELKT